MSNLYEALTRSQKEFPDFGLDTLWEKQPPPAQNAPAEPLPLELDPALAAAIAPPAPAEEYIPEAQPNDIWADVRTLPLHVKPSAPILPFDGTHRRAGEEYRILRTRIVQHPRQPRMMVVTSAGPNDGKTVTVINLSGALALKSGARVLLLDGDFRRSRVCAELGLPAAPGLADVLKGDCTPGEALIQASQIPNLYILPAGEAHLNPAELLDSAKWNSLCDAFRTHFAHVIIDSPPVESVADYDLLQAAADGVIVVTRPDHTNRQHCLKVLQGVPREKMMGVLVNGLKGWFFEKHRTPYVYY